MNKKPFKRCNRVAIELKKIISDLIYKGVSDPRLKNITITEVTLSRDLRTAKVYFVSHKNNKKTQKSNIQGFLSAKGYVKREIARKMRLRYMPDILFFYDESIDYGEHIDKVLKSLNSDINNQPIT